MKTTDKKCPICNGKKEQGKVTFTVDLGTNLIVIRDTPATVCSLCGEEWISDEVAENIEAVVSEAKRLHLPSYDKNPNNHKGIFFSLTL